MTHSNRGYSGADCSRARQWMQWALGTQTPRTRDSRPTRPGQDREAGRVRGHTRNTLARLKLERKQHLEGERVQWALLKRDSCVWLWCARGCGGIAVRVPRLSNSAQQPGSLPTHEHEGGSERSDDSHEGPAFCHIPQHTLNPLCSSASAGSNSIGQAFCCRILLRGRTAT